jgi:alpha-D-ribose 1-methylphosphonate 5-triphosphate synthase subunit PhnG
MYSCIGKRKVVEMKDTVSENNPRKAWMGLLAKAPEGRVAALLDAEISRPAFTWLRAPEIGSTMVRARAGATGAPFNLGEMTITRCALTLEAGEVGHSYIQGRSKEDAEVAALVDALMQTTMASRLREMVLGPLQAEMLNAKAARAAKAAATKVDFFTMTRGED